jgi:serine phosphatase RsbU (regulator of sigma subunit)
VFDRDRVTSVLGFKRHFEVNEWTLMGTGDILLLYTDGLLDHGRDGEPYFPGPMEQTVRRARALSAVDIVHSVLDDVRAFAEPSDDVSLVAIKRL